MPFTVFNGDTIILYCAESTGHVYCEPRSSQSSLLTILAQRNVVPEFPNVQFAVFRITHAKPSSCKKETKRTSDDVRNAQASLIEKEANYELQTAIAFGSTVKLQHIASQKFLSIKPPGPGRLGSGKGDAVFRLLPAHHEKSWGEDICFGDSLRMESVDHKGLRIQCVYNPVTARYNLVLGATGSIISIRSHCTMQSSINQNLVRGGEVVTLKWKKVEGYISVSSSLTNQALPEQLKTIAKVGLRRWRDHQWLLRPTPSSADTCFQLEKVSNPLSGEPFMFGEECRIKHLATRKYLTTNFVNDDDNLDEHRLVLDDSFDGSDADIFRIVPFEEALSSKPVSSLDKLFFENTKSKRVISVNARRKLQTVFSTHHDPLHQWFNLKLDLLCESKTNDHTFVIQKVDEDGLLDIYYVTGLALLLSRHMSKVTNPELNRHEKDNAVKTIQCDLQGEMEEVISKLETTTNAKRLANMMRIMQVTDAMMVLLEYIGAEHEIAQSISLSICSALKKYAESANKKSRVYLAKKQFLDTLIHLVDKGVDVEGVLLALVKDDNEMNQLVKSHLSPNRISIENPKVLEFLRFLGFSSSLEVQNLILQKTLSESDIEGFGCKADIQMALEAFIDQSVLEPPSSQFRIQRESYTCEYDTFEIPSNHCRVHDLSGNLSKMELSIRNFLKQCGLHNLYAKESFQGRNAIILEMLEALLYLVKREVYINHEHTDQVIKHLFEMLDGTTDGLAQGESFKKDERFSLLKLPGNQSVFKIKILLLKTLHLFFNQHLKKSLKCVLWDFKYLYKNQYLEEESNKSDAAASLGISKKMMTQDDSKKNLLESGEESKFKPVHKKSHLNEEIELHQLKTDTAVTADSYEEPSLSLGVLLNKESSFAESRLVSAAQSRLKYLYRRELSSWFDTDLNERVCRILLDLLDYEDGDLRLECADLLFDLFSSEIILLNEAGKSYFVTQDSDCEKRQMMIDVGTMKDKEQILVKMLKLQNSDNPEITRTLIMFANWCVDEKDETKPNLIHQGIAFSSGLFSVVLEYVLEYGPSDHYEQEDVLRACFHFLQKIARGNPRVQKELFKKFHDLIDTNVAVSSMIFLLNEIFSNNATICEEVTDVDVQEMLYTAVASSNPEHFGLTVTLRVILETIPTATSLQEMIARHLVEYWSDNLGYLFGDENKCLRLNLLKQKDDHEPELTLLLNICDLLATCTEGECQVAEELSRSFFPLEEVLEVLCDHDIPIYRKIPYARLMTWTHLNTQRDSFVACVQIAKCRTLWHLLETVTGEMGNLVEMIMHLRPNEKENLQLKLRCMAKLHFTVNQWMEMSGKLNTQLRDGRHLSNHPNALLIFVLEGLLPLLATFCLELSLHMSGERKISPSHMPVTILIEIGKMLIALYQTSVLISSGHLRRLKTCLENMNSLLSARKVTDQPFLELERVVSSFKTTLLENGRMSSKDNIVMSGKQEIELNNVFQTYIEKYQKPYENHPIISNEVDFGLPCSPYFLRVVKLFSDDDCTIRDGKTPLKVEKLLSLISTLVQKQRRQGVQSLEKPKLRKIVLYTLRILYCVVDEQIQRVPKVESATFRKEYFEYIFPLQKRLLDNGAPELLIDLLQYAREDVAFQVLACLNVLLYPGNYEAQKRISGLISSENRGIFVRIHQVLSRTQSSLIQAKMTDALNQFTSLIQNKEENEIAMIRMLKHSQSTALLSEEWVDLESSTKPQAGVEGSCVEKIHSEYPYLTHGIQGDVIAGATGTSNSSIVVLNLLSWLCDGQRRNMQDRLRKQKFFSSCSIVSQVAYLFHGIAENLSAENLKVAQCAVQSLIEMCAGNYENQFLAFKGQVVVSIDQILPMAFTTKPAQEHLLRLKCSCIELLEVMVEETNKLSPQLGKWIFLHLDLKNFLGAMKEIWENQSSLLKFSSKDNIERSFFRAYHVLKRIADYRETTVDQLVGYDHESGNRTRFKEYFGESYSDAKAMWENCRAWSKSIEVVYRANKEEEILTRAYFHYDPHKHLNVHEKNTVLQRIKRKTPEEKLTDLLHWTKAIRDYHHWKESLKKHPIAKWIINASTLRHFMLYWLTIFLNLLVLFFLSAPDDFNPQDGTCTFDENNTGCLYFQPIFNPVAPDWYSIVKYIFGTIHLILAVWMAVQYILKNWSIFTFKVAFIHQQLYTIKKGLLRRRYFYKLAVKLNGIFCRGKFTVKRPVPRRYFQKSFFSFEPLYRISFVFFSLAGLIGSGYFYCGCMIYIFLKNHVLHYILKALGKSALPLLTVFVLGLVVIYNYAVLSFALFSNYFNAEQDLFCKSIFQCFVTITRHGLLDTIGLEIPVRPYSNYEPNFNVVGVRTLYDIVFFVVITTLGLNIVIAILVDRFSYLRIEREKIAADDRSRCLICSIKKSVFQSRGLSFEKHWSEDHSVWNYIHYALYLDSIHENDHNALEKYVHEQIPAGTHKPGSIGFFPLRKAKSLPGYEPPKKLIYGTKKDVYYAVYKY